MPRSIAFFLGLLITAITAPIWGTAIFYVIGFFWVLLLKNPLLFCLLVASPFVLRAFV